MLVSVGLEEELVGSFLGDIADFRLLYVLKSQITSMEDASTYQVEDTGRGSLVFGALGQEKETLSGLSSPGNSALSSGRALLGGEVRGQVLSLDSIVREVEEALGEAEDADRSRVSNQSFYHVFQ